MSICVFLRLIPTHAIAPEAYQSDPVVVNMNTSVPQVFTTAHPASYPSIANRDAAGQESSFAMRLDKAVWLVVGRGCFGWRAGLDIDG
jgi:hypothetical protein